MRNPQEIRVRSKASKDFQVPELETYRHLKLNFVTVLILVSFILYQHNCLLKVKVSEPCRPQNVSQLNSSLIKEPVEAKDAELCQPQSVSKSNSTLIKDPVWKRKGVKISTEVALCAIVKESERYLDEWIDYNFGIGFHSIYLYDNTDNFDLKLWGRRRKNGRKENLYVHRYPGIYRQKEAYNECIETYGQNHTWLAFFDLDEFLVLKKHDNVASFLKDHLPEGALTINWYIFGTSNHTLYAPLPITKRFLYREPQVDHRVKCIIKVNDYGGPFINPHNAKLRGGKWIDTNGGGNYSETGATNPNGPVDVAVLHHYKYKSEKEWYDKGCIMKGITGKQKECGDKSLAGTFYDDSAWVTLKRNVPKYQMFDDWEDNS